MRAREVELQTVSDRSQNFCDLNKLLDTAAKNRDEEEAILGNGQRFKSFSSLFGARVGESNRVDKAARSILAVDRLTITCARDWPNTFGGDYTDFREVVKDSLNNAGSCRDDSRGNRERTADCFPEELCFHPTLRMCDA